MAFTQLSDDLNIIQALDDEPNDVGGLSAQELKAKFDEAGNTIKTYLNDTFLAELGGDDGAPNVGITVIPEMPDVTNVQDALTGIILMLQDVTQGAVADGSITTAKLAELAVTTAKLADVCVTADKVAADAVTTAKIAGLAVTAAKLAADAVETAKIKDGAVTTAKLGSKVVTGDKMADLTITTQKLAEGAVTTSKIGNGAVTEAKIGSGAVTKDKIGSEALYSPIKNISSDYSIAETDNGKTLCAVSESLSDITVAMSSAVSSALPLGAEIGFVIPRLTGNPKITVVFPNGQGRYNDGGGAVSCSSVKIIEGYTMVTIKKTGVTYWMICGNVEVVS